MASLLSTRNVYQRAADILRFSVKVIGQGWTAAGLVLSPRRGAVDVVASYIYWAKVQVK